MLSHSVRLDLLMSVSPLNISVVKDGHHGNIRR